MACMLQCVTPVGLNKSLTCQSGSVILTSSSNISSSNISFGDVRVSEVSKGHNLVTRQWRDCHDLVNITVDRLAVDRLALEVCSDMTRILLKHCSSMLHL